MKLHEVEVIDENAAYVAYRRAVPGGWLYCERVIGAAGQSIACERVPDPTAEHVTHGSGGAAAEAIYRDAVRAAYEKGVADILQAADEVLIEKGVGLVTRGMLATKASAYLWAFRKSQTGEG